VDYFNKKEAALLRQPLECKKPFTLFGDFFVASICTEQSQSIHGGIVVSLTFWNSKYSISNLQCPIFSFTLCMLQYNGACKAQDSFISKLIKFIKH
jgi:hypothetical protein